MQNSIFEDITAAIREQKTRAIRDIAISLVFTTLTVITGLLLTDFPKGLRVAVAFYCGISILLIMKCTAGFIRHMMEISGVLRSGLEMAGKSGRLEGEEAEKFIENISKTSKKMYSPVMEYTRIWTSVGLIAITAVGCYFLLRSF